ncbi:MAG: DUF1566 domain-containing protein [Bacteroidales bacterium]|nr:DUF1566 domain-containing protein [Bacteroidales bacterium]
MKKTILMILVVASAVGLAASCDICEIGCGKPATCPDGAVDLGLSVYWATCNLDASKPEEYGGCYQWAGTEDVTSTSIYLDWNNCPYHSGLEKEGWTKYIPSDKAGYWSGGGSPDNKTILDLEDDIARVKLGGKWRMPTDAEWEELADSCDWVWMEQNGVNGYKITGKKPGYADKFIFLPAAGYRYFENLLNVGSICRYWSSSLSVDFPSKAYNVYFTSKNLFSYYSERYIGTPIRPVSDIN